MAKKFPKFSQALAEDPTTRRLWFGIATAHDFEAHDGMTEQILYQKIFLQKCFNRSLVPPKKNLDTQPPWEKRCFCSYLETRIGLNLNSDISAIF